MTRLSLRLRLAVWFVASLLLILTPVLVALGVIQGRSMNDALDHHLAEDLEVAVEMLVRHENGIAWRTDATRDLGYDAGPQRWVEVYRAEGAPLYFRGLPDREEVRGALPSPIAGPLGYQTIRTPAGAYTRVLAVDRNVGGVAVRIRVARAEDDLRADLRMLVLVSAAVMTLAVLTAALAGYLISGRALKPLSTMAERAKTIGADRLSERLPVENPADELGQLAMVFNDTFARLEDSFERLKRFTADASHQLRTPLTALRSVGEVGLREAKHQQDYEETIGSMLEEADRLSSLVDRLLTLARWEDGRVPPRPTSLDLGAVARTVASQLVVLAEERDVVLDVSIDEPVSIYADALMIQSALMNIVDNAIKFTRHGTRVRLWIRRDGSAHALIVDDQGPGIPEEQRAHVGGRFYRIESGSPDSNREAPSGSGLGLAIASWAMRANRGRLTIESNDHGGTRVVLQFPAAPAA